MINDKSKQYIIEFYLYCGIVSVFTLIMLYDKINVKFKIVIALIYSITSFVLFNKYLQYKYLNESSIGDIIKMIKLGK